MARRARGELDTGRRAAPDVPGAQAVGQAAQRWAAARGAAPVQRPTEPRRRSTATMATTADASCARPGKQPAARVQRAVTSGGRAKPATSNCELFSVAAAAGACAKRRRAAGAPACRSAR